MSLRDLIAAVLADFGFTNGDEMVMANGLLARWEIAEIFDIAAWTDYQRGASVPIEPEVRALLADWRTNR